MSLLRWYVNVLNPDIPVQQERRVQNQDIESEPGDSEDLWVVWVVLSSNFNRVMAV